MFRQTTRRNPGNFTCAILFIVLAALMANGVTFLYHVAEETAAPVCEHFPNTPDEYIRDDVSNVISVLIPSETGGCRYPQQDQQLTRLLYTSIFHPPKAV